MKKKPRQADFPSVETSAYKIRRSADAVRAGLLADAASKSPWQGRVDDLDRVLDFAEPWTDRDILRAHLLANGDLPSDV